MFAVFQQQQNGWVVVNGPYSGTYNRKTIKIYSSELSNDPPSGMDKQSVWGYPVLNAKQFVRIIPYTPTSNELILYHGTSVESLLKIMNHGFHLPKCKELPECLQGSSGCKCNMMGQCIYFSGFDKALRHAQRTSFNKFREKGAMLRVIVERKKWKVATNKLCKCSCNKPYVDHLGSWMKKYDSVFIMDNSLPAVRVSEWCVKNPNQVHIIDFRIYDFTKK